MGSLGFSRRVVKRCAEPDRGLLNGIVAITLALKALDSFRTNEPQISRDYPLNLSISVSGGKETN